MINMALAFYNVGTIWAHEIDIFRSWRLCTTNFHEVQAAHWHALPYWVLAPATLSLLGSGTLIWYHPSGSPQWGIAGAFGAQALSAVLTGCFWGPWQAALSRDPSGSRSVWLKRILRTHWLRTLLVSGSGAIMLAWAVVLP